MKTHYYVWPQCSDIMFCPRVVFGDTKVVTKKNRKKDEKHRSDWVLLQVWGLAIQLSMCFSLYSGLHERCTSSILWVQDMVFFLSPWHSQQAHKLKREALFLCGKHCPTNIGKLCYAVRKSCTFIGWRNDCPERPQHGNCNCWCKIGYWIR